MSEAPFKLSTYRRRVQEETAKGTYYLAPCPFCGDHRSASSWIDTPIPIPTSKITVRCGNTDCGGQVGWFATWEEAKAAWNRRALPWQPITTAPKDGSMILLLWPSFAGTISIGRWKHNPRIKTAYFSDTEEMDDYDFLANQPTHWMPLPDPPVTEGV